MQMWRAKDKWVGSQLEMNMHQLEIKAHPCHITEKNVSALTPRSRALWNSIIENFDLRYVASHFYTKYRQAWRVLLTTYVE